jgi:hypothetical protein
VGNKWHAATRAHQGKLTKARQAYRQQCPDLPSDADTQKYLMKTTGMTRDDVLDARRAAGDKSAYPRKENS